MRILICNDDGIYAPGIAALVHEVADLGEIAIVAPDSPQSAMAHSITITDPLIVQQVNLPGEHGYQGISVTGRPADCVRLAVRDLLTYKPDLMLSGINAGENSGINIFYSGTVAAAAEAAMNRIPAVAFSMQMPKDKSHANFTQAAKHCREVLDKLLEKGLAPSSLTNVNIPDLTRYTKPAGIVVCDQSDADVDDHYHRSQTPEGLDQYEIVDCFSFIDPHHASDVALMGAGYITVTPLLTNLTNHQRIENLREVFPLKGSAKNS